MGRIVFTGGSGKAGRHVIPYLVAQGHQVLNLDLVPLNHPGVLDLKTDLTDAGQVFSALTTHFAYADYAVAPANTRTPDTPVQRPDAVVHFAAYARNMLVPDSECFAANTVAAHNVVEAACKLGIRKVVLASSETVYGVCFAQGADPEFQEFPLDEADYDVDPMDSYALSKICGERIGRGFARRFGEGVVGKGNAVDVYVLRIGNVIEPHEYETLFPDVVGKPETRKRNAWSYVDARDLGQIVHRCVEKDGLGFQIFNATNDGITTVESTQKVFEKFSPGVKITREMGEFEAPLSNKKARDLLGFKEEHNWRKYYTP